MQLLPYDDMPAKWKAFGWNVTVIDGHDADELDRAFKSVQFSLRGAPTVIVAKTVKGKGVPLIEGHGKSASPHPQHGRVCRNHGSALMAAASGASVRQQFADTMLAVGQEDLFLFVVVGDISHGIMQPFARACPGRYYNVGILEPTMMSMCAGLARSGLNPVVHTIAPFLIERSFEQIKLDFCYHKLHGNIVAVGSAFDYSNLGVTHHCYGDFAMLKTLPGVEITYPASLVEFDMLFRQAYANKSVTYYRFPAACTAWSSPPPISCSAGASRWPKARTSPSSPPAPSSRRRCGRARCLPDRARMRRSSTSIPSVRLT